MNRKLKSVYIIILFNLTILGSSLANIDIIASVDNEIITNYDVLKEGRYLKVLNPNLDSLNKKQIYELAKRSLIKEIIKKKEISQLVNLEKEHSFVNEYLSNLLIKLGYEDKKAFNDDLLNNETYSLKEVGSKVKIELFWNELIFTRYNNEVIINEKALKEKINGFKNKKRKEFFLSEIVFQKKKDQDIKETKLEIEKSINEIGFDNTANIFSISESSKLGGKIGWIRAETLSKKVNENIRNLKINEISDIIKLKNSFIILKIDEVRTIEKKIDKEKELQKLIKIETNKKLENFSRIYFNKAKINYQINEK